MTYNPTSIEQEAIALLQSEKTNWESGTVFVTDKIAYRTKNVIKKAIKNYHCIFDNPIDDATGREKFFVPLTKWAVKTVVKSIDLDTKDINIIARRPSSQLGVKILRMVLDYFLKKIHFGSLLNRLLRELAITGEVITKVEIKEVNGRKIPDIKFVSPLNFIIDPAAESIESSPCIERSILPLDEVLELYKDKWNNLEYLEGKTSYSPSLLSVQQRATKVPYVEIWQREGKIPKYFTTGNKEDKEWIEGIIIASNLDSNPVIHKIMENPNKKKSYVECPLEKYEWRWLGVGIPEELFGIQEYVNLIVNIRKNNAEILQNGLFKVRAGRGITQAMLSALRAGGAIPVRDMDDIQQLAVQDFRPSSYKDEEMCYIYADRVTSAFEIMRGETLPSALPATTAVIQESHARTTFDLIRQNFGLFLEKLFEEHYLPALIECLEDEDIIRITGSLQELQSLDEDYANYLVRKEVIDYQKNNGFMPSGEEIEREKQKVLSVFRKIGNQRYLKIFKDIFENLDYEVDVYITEERINKSVLVKQLNDLLLTYSRLPGVKLPVAEIMNEILNMMGVRYKAEEVISEELPIASSPQIRGINRPIRTPAEIQKGEVPTPARVLEAAIAKTQVKK